MPKNITEESFKQLAARNGWRTTKRGWPDFLCFNDETKEIIAVEVKPRLASGLRMKSLKRDQAACLDAMQQRGLQCFVSDGATLEPYDRAKHYENRRRSKPFGQT